MAAKKDKNHVDDELDQDDIDIDADDDFEEEEEEPKEENAEEMEEIESKLEKGEEINSATSDSPSILKARIIYYCPLSKKIYYKNKWIKDSVTDLYTVRTEYAISDKLLERARDMGYFIGSIELYDKNLEKNHQGLLNLIKTTEKELENRMPFDVIIDTHEEHGILYVFTNTTRLAVEIAKAIRYEYHGSIQYEWFERNQFVRVKWYSEIQNRDYFKKSIRASKEKRLGMFSFEDDI